MHVLSEIELKKLKSKSVSEGFKDTDFLEVGNQIKSMKITYIKHSSTAANGRH